MSTRVGQLWPRGVARYVALALAVAATVLGIYYAPLIYRESYGKPFAFMWAVIKLEITDANLVAVTSDSTIMMQECCPEPLTKSLTDFVSARGWTYKDQMGAGIFYEKGDTRLRVISRMLSRRYVVYHLDRTP